MSYCPRMIEMLEVGDVPPGAEGKNLPPGWKIICSWCDVLMRGDPSASTISHGICQRCSEEFQRKVRDGTEPGPEPE